MGPSVADMASMARRAWEQTIRLEPGEDTFPSLKLGNVRDKAVDFDSPLYER